MLDPVDEDGAFAVPGTWGEKIYDKSLLLGTRDELRERPAIAVPEDVQRVIDNVYTDAFLLGPAASSGVSPAPDAAARAAAERRRVAREAAERALANMVSVKPPHESRHDLQQRFSRGTGLIDEALITTRLGADSGQLVCVYEQGHDRWSLDEAGEVPVPAGARPAR
ncbi:hypothetical protein [Embleya sp. NPDC005575]|uniref:hypothetical protein n=1 Tax=Embleya sp. NPDC005575 TaxID=3156892 RepID=UPI0033BCCE9E